jgi:hypothetical protein
MQAVSPRASTAKIMSIKRRARGFRNKTNLKTAIFFYCGGPLHGHRHLVSSNIDWGQDLLFLRNWAQRHPKARPLRIAYNLHLVEPPALGLEAAPKPSGFAPTSTTSAARMVRC